MGFGGVLVVLLTFSLAVCTVESLYRAKRDSGSSSSEEVAFRRSSNHARYVPVQSVHQSSRSSPVGSNRRLPAPNNNNNNNENINKAETEVVRAARQDIPIAANRKAGVPQETNVVPIEVQNNDAHTGQPRDAIPPLPRRPEDRTRFSASRSNPGVLRRPTLSRSRVPSGTAARIDGVLVENIINEAVRKVKEEDRILELRLLLGIDKTITQFETPEPGIFADSPFNITPLSRLSRIINWIGAMLNDNKVPISPRDTLTHPAAVAQRIFCPFLPPICNPEDKYRSIDGKCNNLEKPLLGSAFTPMTRELAPVYGNDPLGKVDLPRTLGTLRELPSARHISSVVHAERGTEERPTRWSMQLTLWGQMLAHDVTDRSPGKGFAQSVMSCCNERIKTPFCYGIPVPDGDSFRRRGKTCLDFTRSAEVTDIDCKLGRREQLNQASSYIDAGFIYGVTGPKLRNLRTGSGGLMATSINDHLPIAQHPNRQASMQGFSFFTTGDDRVNEHTGLMGVETMWVREHNRIAKQLERMNPSWDDETLFQETRRIIGALVQHITYNEYLPQVIGNASMTHYRLWPLKEGYFKGYDTTVNAGVSNVYTTVAGRFGHSMIRSSFSLMDKNFNSTDRIVLPLKDTFFTSVTFLETEHAMMMGTMMDQSEPCDRMVNGDLRDNLHQTKDGNGGDLAASNIQRGRDHGLPSYVAWKEFYGFPKITNFTNGTGGFEDHPLETIELFERVYESPADVDPWTGGISEIPIEDAAVGPLFSNMIGNQFKRLKYGDRFYYESDAQPFPFTPEQLQEIRKVSYASILCNNMPFGTIQPEAFLLTDDRVNAKVSCSDISRMNLAPWREA